MIVEMHTPQGLLLNDKHRALLFDLLRPGDANRLAQVLGFHVQGDIYQALKQQRISRGSSREKALFDFFELPVPPVEEGDEPPQIQSIPSQYALFAHQRDAARKIKAHLYQEPWRVILHMPTGAGKTRTAMHIIADHLRAYEPTIVIWLAYSEELCEQAATEFVSAWQKLGDRAIHVHRFWGNRNLDPGNVDDGIVIASLTKMYRATMKDIGFISTLGSRCSLVIMDEAHEAIAETYSLILNALLVHKPSNALLGLTATPGRTWNDIAADEELAEFFARRKVTLEVAGYDNPVEYLVEQGYLAQAEYTPLLCQSGFSLSAADMKHIQTELELPPSILKKLAEDEQRNLAIVLKVEELAKRHKRILLFAASVEHAQLLATVLHARGLHARSVTGMTPKTERLRLIDEYKNEDAAPKILCNYGVLTTGFDAPQTSAAVIARPTRSLVLYSQMVGRAIRGPKAGGNTTAEIVTVVDSALPGFGNVAEAFKNWEDVWR
jgi:superfamily II DNA or RNA helicase